MNLIQLGKKLNLGTITHRRISCRFEHADSLSERFHCSHALVSLVLVHGTPNRLNPLTVICIVAGKGVVDVVEGDSTTREHQLA